MEFSDRDKERFWSHVDKASTPDTCWIWRGHLDSDGYGRFTTGRYRDQKHWRAHRVSAAIAGMVVGKVVMHTCDNPPCCNPAHLVSATQRHNRYDCVDKRRGATSERGGNAKITFEKAEQIRARHEAGETLRCIARDLQISYNIVRNAARRATYIIPAPSAPPWKKRKTSPTKYICVVCNGEKYSYKRDVMYCSSLCKGRARYGRKENT